MILAEAANDLQAERHSRMVASARQRQRRMRGQRDHVRQRQPAIVVLLLHAIDRLGVERRPREGRHGRGRRQDDIVVLIQPLEALQDARLLGLRPGAVQQRHARAHLEVGARVRPETRRVALIRLPHTGDEALGAQYVEAAMGGSQVYFDGIAATEQMPHGGDLLAERAADVVVHVAAAKVFGVAHTQAAQVHRHRRQERQRIERIGQRVARRHTGRCRELQAGIGHRAAHRPHHRDRRPAQQLARAWHHARRWPETHHAAFGGGNAQRAAGIRSRADRQQVGRQRRGRSARRTTRIEIRIERIARCAPDVVARIGAGSHLGNIGLAGHHGTGGAQARDQHVVLRWHVVAIQRRSIRGQQASRRLQVFHAQWQAVQQPQRLAVQYRTFGCAGFLAGTVETGGRDGVEERVHPLDLRDACVQQLDRRDLLAADHAPQLGGWACNQRLLCFVHYCLPCGRTIIRP